MPKELIEDFVIEKESHPTVIGPNGEEKNTGINLKPGDHVKIYDKDGEPVIRPPLLRVLSTWLHRGEEPMSLTVDDGLLFEEGDLKISS